MNPLRALLTRSRRRPLRVFHDEAYRLPISGLDVGPHALEIRRADDVVHYLRHARAIREADVVNPEPVTWADLALVHRPEYLESLFEPENLAHVFAVDPSDVVVDEVLRSLRLAVGGTIGAARSTLKLGLPVVNTSGGFHHAAPERGAGFCAFNDVAVAIAVLRREGFRGRVAVLDFDFHPPDGTAECLGADPSVWLGSISGAEWGPLPGVDETLLPEGTEDASYLQAVDRLLARVPEVQLAFVLAGADVLAGDRLGQFNLSLGGIRARDVTVAHRLGSLPQVWVPAGGYSRVAWKVLAGVGLTLALDTDAPIPVDYDPLEKRMSSIMRSIPSESLGDDPSLSEDELAEVMGLPRQGPRRFLGFYTAQGLEFGLERYRVLPLLRRLGFQQLRVVIDRVGTSDRARLLGVDAGSGQPVTLIELELEKKVLGEGTFLFVNWLSLRNPRAHFSESRPQLPGQEVPGLGLAREMSEILRLMAQRLTLVGIAFRPSWYHMAFSGRHESRFVDPRRQGRFEALMRDLARFPLVQATRAVAEGRVRLNGAPYTWEAEEMVSWLDPRDVPDDAADIAAERDRCHFTFEPGAPP